MSHLKAAPFVNESTTVSSSSLTSHGPNNSTLTVLPLTPSIIKVTYLPDITRRDPATYAVLPLDSPAHTLTPPTGTPRAAIVPSEATPPNPTITKDTLETSHLKIHLTPAGLLFHTPTADLICSDASSGAYSATAIPNGPVTHRQTMARRGHQPTHTEHFYGAGDSPGRVDRYGTNVKVKNLDAMGYDASPAAAGTPAYKQWPVFHCHLPHLSLTYTIFYDTGSRGSIDFGSEVSAFRGFHRTVTFETGDLEYYFIVSSSFKEACGSLARLIGAPAMPPKFAVTSYTSSSMLYADTPDIPKALTSFLSDCGKHDVSVAGMYLSSGYTSIPDPTTSDPDPALRCVFNWSSSRVPAGPASLFAAFSSTPLICNTKPWLLTLHPKFKELEAAGGLISVPEQMWSGGAGTSLEGYFVDFTTPAGYDWWKRNAHSSLVAHGCRAIWVDNNEYELEDGSAVCGGGVVGLLRPAHTLLMAQASLEALLQEGRPERPCVVTRAGGPGINRHASLTWTGDNYSNWESLQWNTAMHHSLSVVGFAGVSSDVGGFAGPPPSAELFVRWCQSQALSARFTIHSWNDDGSITEPWSYGEEVTAVVRSIIKFREKFGPYIYQLFAAAATQDVGVPVTRPLYYEFCEDANVLTDGVIDSEKKDVHLDHVASCDYMLGGNVLVCPIYVEGVSKRLCYFPKGSTWFCMRSWFWTYEGGQIVEIENTTEHGHPIHFLRGGCGVQLKAAELPPQLQETDSPSEDVVVVMFMDDDEFAECEIYLDDDEPDLGKGRWYYVEARGDEVAVRACGEGAQDGGKKRRRSKVLVVAVKLFYRGKKHASKIVKVEVE